MFGFDDFDFDKRSVRKYCKGPEYFSSERAWWTTYGVLAPQGKSTTWGGFISRLLDGNEEIPRDFRQSMDADSDRKCEVLWGESCGSKEGIFHYLELKKLSDILEQLEGFYCCQRFAMSIYDARLFLVCSVKVNDNR